MTLYIFAHNLSSKGVEVVAAIAEHTQQITGMAYNTSNTVRIISIIYFFPKA